MIIDIIVAFLIALALSALIWPRHHDCAAADESAGFAAIALVSLMVLFPMIWAGGLWMTPIGAPIWGSYWLSFVFVGLFAGLLILASAPPRGRGRRQETRAANDADRTEDIAGAFGITVWILLIASVVAIFLAYVEGDPTVVDTTPIPAAY